MSNMNLYETVAAYALGWAAFHRGMPYLENDPALEAIKKHQDISEDDLVWAWAVGWIDANKSSSGVYPGLPFPEVYFLSQVTYLAWGAKTTSK